MTSIEAGTNFTDSVVFACGVEVAEAIGYTFMEIVEELPWK